MLGRSPVSQKDAELAAEPWGTVIVPHDSVYAATESLNFIYGPTFRRIKQAAFPCSTCMTTVLAPADAALLKNSVSDFTAFDAALHGMFAGHEGGITYFPLTRMMPTRFARVRVFRSGAAAAKTIGWTMRRSATSALVDIDLVDASGAVVLTAEGVRTIEAPGDATLHPASISYRVAAWTADREGIQSPRGWMPARRMVGFSGPPARRARP
jgi:hypothetical protein